MVDERAYLALSDMRNRKDLMNLFDREAFDFHGSGFPCQSYSACGASEGDDHPRIKGLVAVCFVKLFSATRPGICFLENVDRFPASTSCRWIKAALAKAGLAIREFVLKRSAWLPQRRKRYYLVGTLYISQRVLDGMPLKVQATRMVALHMLNVFQCMLAVLA